MVRFVALFAAALLGFQLVFLLLIAGSEPFARYLELCARWSGALLTVLGNPATVEGNRIAFADCQFVVSTPCSGLQPMAMLAIAVLAFPSSWRAKLIGLAAGTAALLALNVARIASLCLVELHAPGAFETVHLALWPMALILCSIALWVGWARRVSRA